MVFLLDFNKKSFLSLRRRTAKWNSLFELPKNKFPETIFNKLKSEMDWLNIRSFYKKNASMYIHSTGGCTTRTKSGNPFEFSIVGEFDSNFKWIKNHTIKEGTGSINTTSEYFILKLRKKRNKVIFYDSLNFEIIDELSLTPKQNLGAEKIINLKFDSVEDTFILFNHRFLNICKIIS